MELIQKIDRIKALVDYVEYKKEEIPLNYQLNNMLNTEGKIFNIKIKDIYQNEYRVYNESDGPNLVEPEQWETIVSDIYTQLYSIAYQKANKIALEKITIAEIEFNIREYTNKNK